MVKQKIYSVETKSYMMFKNKPSYIGNDVHFLKASSKQNAQQMFTKKYKNGLYKKI